MAENDARWGRPLTDPGGESEWEHLGETVSQEIKFHAHVHYLRQYLTGRERVVEIGAGRGRFTAEMAALCGSLVVADISPTKLQLNQRSAQSMGYAQRIEDWVECDVADLRCFQDAEFDAVVCYGGPLSYVTDRRDKALAEMLRITKPGGRLFLSVMSLWGEIHSHFAELITRDIRLVQEIAETGDIGPEAVALASSMYHAYRSDELVRFLEGAGLVVETLSASDCLSSTWGSLLGNWRQDERRWRALLEMELAASRHAGCVDMGSRLIAVARKAT